MAITGSIPKRRIHSARFEVPGQKVSFGILPRSHHLFDRSAITTQNHFAREDPPEVERDRGKCGFCHLSITHNLEVPA